MKKIKIFKDGQVADDFINEWIKENKVNVISVSCAMSETSYNTNRLVTLVYEELPDTDMGELPSGDLDDTFAGIDDFRPIHCV